MILTPDAYQNSVDFISDRMSHVRSLTKNLFKLIGINHFVFSHVDHKNKNALASLHVNMGPSTYWVEHSMPLPIALPTGFYLASQFKELFSEEVLTTLREKFSADHILFYVQHNHSSTDMFSMGADPDHKFVLNNYINHSQNLLKFLLHFRQETRELMEEAKKHAFNYDFSLDRQKKLFPDELEIPNYNGFSSLYDIADVLSPRELECLQLMGATVTIKSIAKKLNLSPRTVESYLLNVKNKLNCDSTSEMLELYHAVNF